MHGWCIPKRVVWWAQSLLSWEILGTRKARHWGSSSIPFLKINNSLFEIANQTTMHCFIFCAPPTMEKLTNLPPARCQKVSRKGPPDSQTASVLSLQIPPTVWEVPSSRRNLSSAPAAMGIKNLHTHLVIHYHFKSSKTPKEQIITSCVPHSYATWLQFYTIQSKCAPKQRPHVC